MNKLPKVVFIANIPSHYRVVFFNELYKQLGNNLTVLYCAKTEPNRSWDIADLNHRYIFLRKSIIHFISRYMYMNIDVVYKLMKINPDIIITGGFFPTMLIAILYARIKKIKHIINTDAWEINEIDYNWYQIVLRKIFYSSTDAFLPVGIKGKDNFIKNYSINQNRIFIVPYAVDDKKYFYDPKVEKKYDIIFVGQFIDRKMPFFVVDVIRELNKIINNVSIVLIGDGPLKDKIIEKLKNYYINFEYIGYLQPDEIIAYYKKSKILLFPTERDGWGVVANEALSLGVPCITNNRAGCAGELVIDNYTGYVTNVNVSEWVRNIYGYLTNNSIQNKIVNNCITHSKNFTPQIAALKFHEAVNFCMFNQ